MNAQNADKKNEGDNAASVFAPSRRSACAAEIAKLVRSSGKKEDGEFTDWGELSPECVRSMSGDECFKFALQEVPERSTKFDNSFFESKLDEDPCVKKTKSFTDKQDLCTIALSGRVIDLMLGVLKSPCSTENKEQMDLLDKLNETFPSKLSSAEDIKIYFDELANYGDGGTSSGTTNHPLLQYQHVPRAMRALLIDTRSWKAMNFNKRKGVIRHLLTEFDPTEIASVCKYVEVEGVSTTSLKEVSLGCKVVLNAAQLILTQCSLSLQLFFRN